MVCDRIGPLEGRGCSKFCVSVLCGDFLGFVEKSFSSFALAESARERFSCYLESMEHAATVRHRYGDSDFERPVPEDMFCYWNRDNRLNDAGRLRGKNGIDPEASFLTFNLQNMRHSDVSVHQEFVNFVHRVATARR